MRTVTFKSVLDGVATRMGLEPDANLQLNQAAAITEYIDTQLGKAWAQAAWPEWTTSEPRQFRADWSDGTTYAVGDEVYYAQENAYYRAIQAGTANLPTDTAWWEPASDLDTYIAFEQAWEAKTIAQVWDVYLDDPRKSKHPRRVGWWLGPEGVWVAASGATKVYPEFSLPAPSFTTRLWDAATVYVAGDLVYYDGNGECYQAQSAPTTGVAPPSESAWARQTMPKVLARYVKLAAIGDALREDENVTKASAWDLQADFALNEALERAVPAMRTAATYGCGQ